MKQFLINLNSGIGVAKVSATPLFSLEDRHPSYVTGASLDSVVAKIKMGFEIPLTQIQIEFIER